MLVEDDVDAPAVPEVHHQAALRDPLGEVVGEPSQAELTAKSREKIISIIGRDNDVTMM